MRGVLDFKSGCTRGAAAYPADKRHNLARRSRDIIHNLSSGSSSLTPTGIRRTGRWDYDATDHPSDELIVQACIATRMRRPKKL